ncbi:LamG-like jellyroll fold domain-containing protein [Luteolibacter soli]|uniref:LamG-like jellyroll fold domain-containing protein n=1 Tax=Luteolibacter soli TaxID=3135280 RepID=A0ABU9B227_9BACT
MSTALSLPVVEAALVGQWRGTDYVDGQNWTSTPATGSKVATLSGSGTPVAVTSGYAPGTKAVDMPGSPYFVVSQANNPINGATAMSLVAIFKPNGLGSSGGGFYNGSGLIGNEVGGVTEDWGFTWNGSRVSGAAPGNGVMERTIFSDPVSDSELKVAMFTWSNTGVQQIYVNGVLVSSQNTGVMAPRISSSFALGASTSGGSNPFNGQIAELRMYNSDESANAATIASDLRNTYATDVMLESAALNPAGGRFVLVDTTAGQINAAGTFTFLLDGNPTPVTVSKSGARTTVTFAATIDAATSYAYDLTVPKVGGGSANYFSGFTSHRLPVALPGLAGSVGTWGIREISTGDTPLPPNVGNIVAAVSSVLNNPATVEGSAPVFNHADPDTNDQGGVGNFNNDFNILTNAAGEQNFVVVGKTKVTITTPGELRTFSIHSDDGFIMRVTGPGGGRFVHVGGDAQIDDGDFQSLYRDGGTGDSNSRGTFRFDAAGTYDITYLGWDGGGGGYYEVAWAPGTYFDDRDTNLWRLIGNDTDPSIPPFRERWAINPPGPLAGNGTFGVRTFLNAAGVTGIGNMSTFLDTTTRTPANDAANTVDAQVPYLNHRDPNNGGFNRFIDDRPFPGNNNGVDENNVATVAKGRISIPTTGTYTFITTSDDGFVFRLKGTNGAPDPSFRRVTCGGGDPRFQMSNPNEVYFDQANQETRCIVDLAAGSYDIEYLQVENVGGFCYELGVAAGEWPHQTTPPGGFQLVGVPASTVLFPAIAAPGWTVESSIPGLNQFASNIAGAEAKISYTQGLATNDPVWTTLGLNPANRTTTWASLDFNDPQDGSAGSFSPTNPWPLNTTNADNDYAIRATGNIIITQAGYYHLGFQGDDGGYMYIYGVGGNTDPAIDSIVFTHHPQQAAIGTAPGSTVNNAVRTDVGTGNSRTIVRVFLQAGQYQIKTLFFEGGGGSWWEVIGSSETAAYNYPLLTTTAGSAPVNGGLALIEQTVIPNSPGFQINQIVLTGHPVTSVSFNIAGQPGQTYTVQGSTNLTSWVDLTNSLPATGNSTPFSVNLSSFPALSGQQRVFFRATVNP